MCALFLIVMCLSLEDLFIAVLGMFVVLAERKTTFLIVKRVVILKFHNNFLKIYCVSDIFELEMIIGGVHSH